MKICYSSSTVTIGVIKVHRDVETDPRVIFLLSISIDGYDFGSAENR